MKKDPKYKQLHNEAVVCLTEGGYKLITELKSFQDMVQTNPGLAMEAVFLAAIQLGVIVLLKIVPEKSFHHPAVSKHMKKAFAHILEEQIVHLSEVKKEEEKI